MAQQSYLIKILSGSNAGGEIEFFSTSLLIGDTDECDVVLGDPFLEQRSFRMDIFEDTVSIVRSNLPFYVNGSMITDPEFSANFYSVITVGSTSFVVGETNVLWPDIVLPEIFLDTDKTFEENSELSEQLDEIIETNEENNEEELELSSLNTLIDEDINETIPPFEAPQSGMSKIIKALKILLILLLIGGSSFMLWKYAFKKPDFGTKAYIININTLLREKGFTQLRIGVRKPDLLIITGFVDKKEDINIIENLIYDKAPKVLLFIKDMAQVLQEIQQYFIKEQIFATVKYLPAISTLTISGYMKDQLVLDRVQKALQDLWPAFKKLRWKIVFWKELKPIISSEFLTTDLTDIITVTPYNFTIGVKGDVTDADRKAWYLIKDTLLSSFNLIEEVFIEKLRRVRSRQTLSSDIPAGDKTLTKPILDEGLLTILGIKRDTTEYKLSDLPQDTNFEEVMAQEPCKYISIVPGEILFVKINGEQGLYSAGSMLPGALVIRDILEKTIILENKEKTFIFCTKN